MLLTFDTDRSCLITQPGFTSSISSVRAERGDGEHLQIVFIRNGVPWQAPSGTELRMIVKGGGEADPFADGAPALALADTFTYDTVRQAYTADINYMTAPLTALFTEGVTYVEAKAQFAWRTSSIATWKRSQPVDFVITKQLWTGLDGAPDETEVSSNYATKSEVIRYFPSFVGLTGGGDTKLDGLVTAELPLQTAVALVDSSSSETLRVYELVTGTDAESSPNVIRGDDFNASTNPRVWKLRFAATDVSALGDTVALKSGVIQYVSALVGLTGGGDTKLDGLATLGLSLNTAVALFDNDAAGALRVYELASGTDAESVPDVVRGDDFNASTNAVVWKLRNPSLVGVNITTPQVFYVEKTVGNDATAAAGNPAKPWLTEQAAFDAAVATGQPAVIKFGVGHWVSGIVYDGNWPSTIQLVGMGFKVSRLAAVTCTPALPTNGTSHSSTPTDGGAGPTGRTIVMTSDLSLRIDNIIAKGSDGGGAGAYTAPAASETNGSTGKAGGDGGAGGSVTLTDVAFVEINVNGGDGADGGQGQQGGSATGTSEAGDGGSGGPGGDGGAPGDIRLVGCRAISTGAVQAQPGLGGDGGLGGDAGVNSDDDDYNGDPGAAGSAGSGGPTGTTPSRLEMSRVDQVIIDADARLDNSLYVALTISGTATNNNSTQIASL